MSLKRPIVVALSVVTMAAGSTSDAKATSLVLNGGFEDLAGGPNHFFETSLPSFWTKSGGVAFIFAPGAADGPGVDGGLFYLWGPDNPAPNSLNGLPDTSPHNGGNYLASDADTKGGFSGPISQTIVGLIPGGVYALTFEWAAAQLRDSSGSNWNGYTHSAWQVTLGSAGTQTTSDAFIASHGFSGWMDASFIFNVPTTSTGTEVLTFLAVGGPTPLPPMALLDGVSLEAVPEPATLLLMCGGAIGIRAVRRQRANQRKVT